MPNYNDAQGVADLLSQFDFNIIGEGTSLYVNEEGLFTCPPNRAVYATKGMEEAGYLSMMDYSSPVKEGEL